MNGYSGLVFLIRPGERYGPFLYRMNVSYTTETKTLEPKWPRVVIDGSQQGTKQTFTRLLTSHVELFCIVA